MVEDFGIQIVIWEVADGYGEFAILVLNVFHRRAEPDHVAHPSFFHAAFDIVKQHGAGRVRCDLFAEVFLERIVGKF